MTPARRRPVRGSTCDDPPRLWDTPAPVEARAPVAVAAPIAPPGPVAAPAAPPAVTAPESLSPRAAPTLDDLMSGAWDGLAAGGTVACPICAAEMRPRWSAGAGVVGGRCGGCGTTIE